MVENQVFRRAGGSIGTIWRMWKKYEKNVNKMDGKYRQTVLKGIQ